MPQQLKQRTIDMLEQLKTKWEGIGRAKQLRFITAALILIAALCATIYILTKPKMVVLQANMDPQQLSQAVSILTDNGIKNQIGNNTTSLSVQEKDVDRARLILADVPELRTVGFTYDDALDVSMGTTESTKTKMMILARQTEIEQSIMLLYDVKNAVVIINSPDSSPRILLPQDRPVASVVLDLNSELTARQVEAIAYHVAKSVQNLEIENVSIMDTNGRPLYQAEKDGLGGSMTARQEAEYNKKQEIEEQVRTLLGPQYNTVDVMANLRWDWSGGQIERETYSPPVEGSTEGVPSKTIINESEVSNTEPAAEPGMQGNNGEVPNYPTGENGSSEATTRSEDTQYLYNRELTTTSNPTGTLIFEDSSIAIRAYLNRSYYEDVVREAGELDNITWEDYQTNIRLNPVVVNIPEQTPELVRTATGIQTVVMEVYELPTFINTEQVVRPINQLLMAGVLLLLIAILAFGLIRRTQPEVITEIEPELSVEELLVSTSAQEKSDEEDESVQEIDIFADSELKKQINKFVDEKPEAAAQLLRNWLSEEWE